MSRLFATCHGLFFLRIDLAMHVSGEFEIELVLSSAVVCIGLL